jgi:hypothetical protein
MESLVSGESSAEESAFLNQLLTEFVPRRVKSLVHEPSRTEAKQLVALLGLTGTVGVGYLYGLVKW